MLAIIQRSKRVQMKKLLTDKVLNITEADGNSEQVFPFFKTKHIFFFLSILTIRNGPLFICGNRKVQNFNMNIINSFLLMPYFLYSQ